MLTTDIQAPFDPTGYVTISGAQLLQLVSGAYPQTDKGLVCVSADDNAGNPNVPNALVTTKWQNYIWVRQSATSVGVYVWNPNGATDATFLKWVSVNIAGIGAGSIVNNMIADNTIQSAKIVSLEYSKLTGAPTGSTPTGTAGGSLAGTYPNPSLADGAVTVTKITDLCITAAKIQTCIDATTGIDYTKLRGDGVAKDMLRSKADSTQEWFTPPVIFTSGVVVPTANALKIPQVNAGATDFQMVAPTTLGRILQIVETEDASTDNTASNWASNALPTTANGKHYVALDTAITPLNAGSTLLIEAGVWLASGAGAGQMLVAALFQDAGGNAIAVGHVGGQGNAGSVQAAILRLKVASGSLTARTFKIYFGGTTGTTYLNGTNAGAIWGGGFPLSWLRVTEYI